MKRSNVITPEGARMLRSELADLWKVQRPEVTKALQAAAAEGDRSENAEYIYRKKQLREMDRRIRYLQKRTSEIQVVERLPSDLDKIFFGAVVTLEDEDEVTTTYRIVGSDEFDQQSHYISVDSPLARQLLGKSVGDQLMLRLPKGQVEMEIIDVEYQPLSL